MQKKFRKFLTRVINELNRPIVRNISKFSGHLLQTIDLVKDRNPLTIAAATFSVANSLAESFNLPQLTQMESFLTTLDVEHGIGHLPSLIYTSDLYSKLDKNVVFSSEDEEIVELILSETDKLYLVQYKNSQENYQSPSSPRDEVGMDFFYTKGFDFENLFAKLWEMYPYGIYLKRNKRTHTLELRSLPQSKPEYIGSHDLEKFCLRLKKARAEKISRSFLFHGPPGVGKTTSVLQVAYRHFNRIIRIDPAIARTIETGEIEFFINQIKPEIIAFEDFDRAYSSVEVALSMLENIKLTFPEVIIFATVNNISKLDPALLRPGRFDKMLYFGYPQESEYPALVKMYFDQYNPGLSEDHLALAAELCVGLSPAYVKELAIESRNFSHDTMEQELEETTDEYHHRIKKEKKAFFNAQAIDGFDDDDDDDLVEDDIIGMASPDNVGKLSQFAAELEDEA